MVCCSRIWRSLSPDSPRVVRATSPLVLPALDLLGACLHGCSRGYAFRSHASHMQGRFVSAQPASSFPVLTMCVPSSRLAERDELAACSPPCRASMASMLSRVRPCCSPQQHSPPGNPVAWHAASDSSDPLLPRQAGAMQAEGLHTGQSNASSDVGTQDAASGNVARLSQENQQLRGQLLALTQNQEWAMGSVVASKDREIAELSSRLRYSRPCPTLVALVCTVQGMHQGVGRTSSQPVSEQPAIVNHLQLYVSQLPLHVQYSLEHPQLVSQDTYM